MDNLHLTLLRQIAEWADRHGERVALDHSVLTALLDEIDLLRSGLQASARQIAEMQATLDVPAVEPPPLKRVIVSAPEPTDVVCTCGKTFMNARALAVHVRRSADHKREREARVVERMSALEVLDEPPVCPICGADGFKDARGLGGHIWGKHHIRASEMKAE